MSCEFESRVSERIDGEASPADAERVARHLAGCESCRQLERELLHLGRAVRAYDPVPQRSAADALGAVMAASHGGFWRRPVTVPLSVAVAAVLAIVVLGVGVAYRPVSRDQQGTRVRPAEPEAVSAGLDRFDRGQRAILYTVPNEVF